MTYPDKIDKVVRSQAGIYNELQGLHPTDKAEAYKEVGRLCNEEGDRLQERNAQLGVPEREGDQS